MMKLNSIISFFLLNELLKIIIFLTTEYFHKFE